mmetsp:Transcript_105476/g.298068  ORF Transcript_105476/g.298068 Transcript_105476/m.298068 type:complete len:208 (-) Transcript_105476:136-759(-)
MKKGSSKYARALLSVNTMSVTAGLEPRPTCTTVAAKTAASSRLTMLQVSSLCGGFTTSTAKKRPAMGALKPAATPAAQPDASSPNFTSLFARGGALAWPNLPRKAARLAPISTAGPSGPREFPAPSVAAARPARRTLRRARSPRSRPNSPTPSATASSRSAGRAVPSRLEAVPRSCRQRLTTSPPTIGPGMRGPACPVVPSNGPSRS